MPGVRWIPTIAPRHDPSTPAVDLYTAMLGERIVFLVDPLGDAVAMDVAAQLLYLDADGTDRDISLYLNGAGTPIGRLTAHQGAAENGDGGSEGGDDPRPTSTAMTIVYDAIRSVGCDVQTVCLGQVGFTTAVLLAAGTPGKRLIAPYARVLLQEPASDIGQARADDLAIQAAEMRRSRDLMIALLAEHTGQSVERIDQDLRRPKILTAAEAIEYGLADRLVATRETRPTRPAPAARPTPEARRTGTNGEVR